jgi:hypothetical protein
VQFNAGKCNLAPQEDGSFLVTPDRRKGKISLHKGSDNLLHFKWTDRSTNAPVIDLIVFSDEVVFKRVITGTPSDRVYMLKWKIGDRREMFWLQDKRTENDSDNCEKLNRFIANPDATTQPAESDNLVRMLRYDSLLLLLLFTLALLVVEVAQPSEEPHHQLRPLLQTATRMPSAWTSGGSSRASKLQEPRLHLLPKLLLQQLQRVEAALSRSSPLTLSDRP